jgi:two-component system, sensor histidine kinase and response regulator
MDTLLPAMILGDSLRVRQILTNLIHNAIKFTERGWIRITATRQGTSAAAELHIAVEDTGCGVPVNKHEAIFEAFTQAAGCANGQLGGTGLGLAISGQLVQLMGGRIWLESTLGKASTFQVALPLFDVQDGGAHFAATHGEAGAVRSQRARA